VDEWKLFKTPKVRTDRHRRHTIVSLSCLGWVLVDRDGKHFNLILNYLRDGSITLPDCSQALNELLQEAKFYCIQPMVELVEQQLRTRSRKNAGDTDACCKVIMLTSAKELPNIIATVRKPIVKLAINRHNNKYSYTASVFILLYRIDRSIDQLFLQIVGRDVNEKY
jgi:BTB/POZ domain-containing adapter for CUL3-mediated RhoA degradation protein